MKYLVNAISLNMLPLPSQGSRVKMVLDVDGLTVYEFCKEVKDPAIVNAVGHQGTADIVNSLCYTKFRAERREIKVGEGDILVVVQLLVRLPEGKILTYAEIEQLLKEGKVAFYRVSIK